MALRIVEAVLLAGGIEVAPGGLEVGRIALRLLMEVDGMNSGRQTLEIELHFHARLSIR